MVKVTMRHFPSETPYVFDNDCLASFLWVKRMDILNVLLKGNILIPSLVEAEFKLLETGQYGWVYKLLETELSRGNFQECSLPARGEIADEFYRLISFP
ncbi:MAG: hypothetical protein ACPLRA_07025 [Candidatus Saccharicenans sp.]